MTFANMSDPEGDAQHVVPHLRSNLFDTQIKRGEKRAKTLNGNNKVCQSLIKKKIRT